MIYVNGQPTAEFVPEIADNLTTDDSSKALSAKQGKVLNEKTADDIPYSSGVSVKDKIGSMETATGGSCTDTTLTVSLIKVGRIVFGNISDGNASASAGSIIAKFPSGFVPNNYSFYDFRDSYSQKRLQINKDGIKTVESVNNILRGTFVYYV